MQTTTPRQLLAFVRSTKGATAALATVAGVLSVVVGGGLGRGLGAVAVTAGGVALFLTAASLSQHHRELRRLGGLAGRRAAPTSGAVPTSAHRPVDAGTGHAAADHAVEAARHELRGRSARRAAADLSPGRDLRDGDDAPLVTVVIPCFNEERFLLDAIRSVQQQTVTDWECVVVDDASTDASPRIANTLAAKDDRITVVRHRVNGGLSASRNTGLRLARGAFVTFLDGDDLLTSESLSDRLRPLSGVLAQDVVGSYGGVRFAPEDVRLDDLEPSYAWKHKGVVDLVTSRGECPFNCHAPLSRTDVLRAMGGFDESMRDGAEDWDMWLRLQRAGFAWVPGTRTTAIYRQKRRSMVRDKLLQHVELSTALLASAHAPIDPAALPIATSEPLVEPLSHYEQQVKLAARLQRSAAMALLGDDEGSAREILKPLGDVPSGLIARHASVVAAARAGVRRTFGLEPGELPPLAAEISGLAASLGALVDDTVGPREVHLVRAPAPTHDVVAVPATAAQARVMAAMSRDDDADWVFVDVARTAGEQGAAAVLEDEGVTVLSLNELVLTGASAGALVVASPRTHVVESLVREVDASRVHDVQMDGLDVMEVEGAPERVATPTLRPHEAVPSPSGPEPVGPWRGDDRRGEVAWRLEEYPATTFDPERMEAFRDRHAGERCVVIGNGPSLNDLDLTLLRDEATIGVNGIFYKTDEIGIDLLYYVVEDTAVMADNLDRIRDYRARGHRFFPSIYRDRLGSSDDTTFFMMNRGFYAPESPDHCIPRFSTDLRQRVFTGQSVTIINLQLAHWMGFREVALIGMDFSYTIPDDAEVSGDLITSRGDDPNHFHPDYFGKGKVWKDPKLDRVLANYQAAKLAFEADGRRIVNATAGGRLELFPRVDYEDWLAG